MSWCRLAILTDEVSQELEEVIRFAREERLEGIEVRSLFGRAFKDLTKEDLKSIATAAKDAGLAIAGCASPVFKCDLDSPAEIAAHVDLFKRAVEAARYRDRSSRCASASKIRLAPGRSAGEGAS